MDDKAAGEGASVDDGREANDTASGVKSLYKQRSDDSIASVINWLYILGILLAVYCLGMLGLSILWVFVGVALCFWREMTREQGRRRAILHRGFHNDERQTLMATMAELPSWVSFSDNERVEWINKIINRFWPYLNGHLKAWCMTSLQANIQVTHPALASFRFDNVDLGDIPPRIAGVKVYTENTQRDELYLDLDLRFCSSSSLRCKVKGVPLGVNDLQMCGPLRLVFKPLTTQMPLFGCMNIFFLDNPSVDFNLDFAANVLDIPGLHGLIRGVIIENIAWIMVAPSRIAIPMIEGVNTKILKYPPPQGVVRLVIVEARDLKCTDSSLFGKGKSDPYVIVKVGDTTQKTKVVYNNLNPTWEETIELCIDSTDGRVVEFDVYDYDVNSRDDHIGHTSLDITEVSRSGYVNLWLPLEGVKRGSLHLTARWLYLSQNPASLPKEIEKSEVSTCILIVNLDSAHDMPQLLGKEVLVGNYVNLNKKNKEQKLSSPVVHCILSVGKCKKESWERMNEYNRNPVWEQNFRFFVQNPIIQSLELQFQDLHLAKKLGTLSIPLKSLLREPDMTVYKNFKLDHSGEKSSVVLRASLRILTEQQTDYSEKLLSPSSVSLNNDMDQDNKCDPTSSNNAETESERNKEKNTDIQNKGNSKRKGNEFDEAAPSLLVCRTEETEEKEKLKNDTHPSKMSSDSNEGNDKPKTETHPSKTSSDSNEKKEKLKKDNSPSKKSSESSEGKGKPNKDKHLSKKSNDSAKSVADEADVGIKESHDQTGHICSPSDVAQANTSTSHNTSDGDFHDGKITTDRLPTNTTTQDTLKGSNPDTTSGNNSQPVCSLPSEILLKSAVPTVAVSNLISGMHNLSASSGSDPMVSLQIQYHLDLKKERFFIRISQCRALSDCSSSSGIYVKVYLLSEKDAVLVERKTEVRKEIQNLGFEQHLEFPIHLYLTSKKVRVMAKQKKGGKTIGTNVIDTDEFKNTKDKNYAVLPGNITAFLLSVNLYAG